MDVPRPAQNGPGSYLQVSSSLIANLPSAKLRLGFNNLKVMKWPRGPSCHVFLVGKKSLNALFMTGWPSAGLWPSMEGRTNSTAQTVVPAPKGMDSPWNSVGSLAAFVGNRSSVPIVNSCLGLDIDIFDFDRPGTTKETEDWFQAAIEREVDHQAHHFEIFWYHQPCPQVPTNDSTWFHTIPCLRPGLFGSTVQANPKFLSKRGSGVAFLE